MNKEKERNNISDKALKMNPLEDENETYPRIIYNCKDIKRILMKSEISKDLIEKIKDEYISKEDKKSIHIFEIKNKKRKKEKSSKKDKKILGRKRNSDKTERKHNKNGADNIIKKCKGIFFSKINLSLKLIFN